MTENPADHKGLPDPSDARQDALLDLRATVDLLVQQVRDEAFSDLGLCVDAVKQKAARIQAFDKAIVDLLPETQRDEARRYLRSRDASSLYSQSFSDDVVPF